jgi:hypothetical protein
MINNGGIACSICYTARPSLISVTSSTSTKKNCDDGIFSMEKLSESVWKVVENDRFGQFPFLYVIVGVDKCVIFDTGCDSGIFRVI